MNVFIRTLRGKTGKRQIGYEVVDTEGKVIATFKNKEYGYWRFAKEAAERKCYELNR